MKIKDIVNRDIVNLQNCDQEPIHIPGSVQPYGVLVALRKDNLTIDFCSGNVDQFFGVTHLQCLGKKFADVFGGQVQDQVVDYLQSVASQVNPPITVHLFQKPYLCSGYQTDTHYVMELEPEDVDASDLSTLYNQAIQFIGSMEQSETLQQLCSKVADQTRAITGYDRVMIYRFDKDYNGEVFAESRVNTVEPFLGLHYPHTDIPAQARQLYLTNLMRIIADVNYTPVPIYTIDDAPGKNLDLGKSYLRSVSPIHIEYLQNMGVGATMTISLLHEGQLWGLITCHHYSAKYVPLHSRIAAQMQGYFLTSQIKVRQLNEEYKIGAAINSSLEKLLDEILDPSVASFEKIVKDPALLALCNASGAAIVFEGEIYTAGKTPEPEAIKRLADWLNEYTRHGEYNTSRLADVYPDAKNFASTGAGIIYHSLSGLQDDAIIWFTPETMEEVHWGGDPKLAIVKNEKGLSPRKSFDRWKEILQFESRAWKQPELMAAASYAHSLQKHITLILITGEEKKHRELTEKLQEANTDLENINWISSHDLREPLRKIQLFSSKVLDEEEQELSNAALQSLRKVTTAAHRMQQLITDITAYNKVRQLDGNFRELDLMEVMDTVAAELNDDITEKGASLSYHDLPEINGIELLLKQLLLNLVRNSMKFSRPNVPPVVTVIGSRMPVALPEATAQRFYEVVVSDNGIGFDNSHAEEIFKVFTRLHSKQEFDGTGVGLSLCRKIMQHHKGYIKASGKPGEGATFMLYFPVSV